MIKSPLFPLWQIDQQEYKALCAYLQISPQDPLFDRLADYLLHAPFRYSRPTGFSLFLAKPKLSKFRIARLDMLSKFFIKDHPVRYILNGAIALYECDGQGYAEISAAPVGWKVPFSLIKWGGDFALSLSITVVWFFWQYLR